MLRVVDDGDAEIGARALVRDRYPGVHPAVSELAEHEATEQAIAQAAIEAHSAGDWWHRAAHDSSVRRRVAADT